jgi:hypothetical protein
MLELVPLVRVLFASDLQPARLIAAGLQIAVDTGIVSSIAEKLGWCSLAFNLRRRAAYQALIATSPRQIGPTGKFPFVPSRKSVA